LESFKGSNANNRWKMWGVLAIAFFIVFFNRYTMAVIAGDLSAELSLSGVQLSVLASMYFYSYGLMQIPVGILAETIGPRKLTTWGMFLCGVSTIIFAISSNIWVMYISRLAVGIGASTILVSIFTFLSVHFSSDEFVKVYGWTTLIGNLGGLSASAPFAILVTLVNWRVLLILLGVISLLIALCIWKIVDEKPHNDEKADMLKFKDIFEAFMTIGKSVNTWICFFMLFSIYGVMNSFAGLWGNSYISQVYSVSTRISSNHVMFYTLGFITASLIIGWIEKKISSRNLMIKTGAGLTFLLWFLLIFVFKLMPELWILKVIFFLLGFIATFVSVVYAKAKDNVKEGTVGLVMGLINLAPFLGSSLFNYFIGITLDKTWVGNMHNGVRYYDLKGYFQSFTIYLVFSCVSFIVSMLFFKNKISVVKVSVH
jgi:sugar phosphate permease